MMEQKKFRLKRCFFFFFIYKNYYFLYNCLLFYISTFGDAYNQCPDDRFKTLSYKVK